MTVLPHPKPTTPEHIKANIKVLNKIHRDSKDKLEHHEFHAGLKKTFIDKVLPKWENNAWGQPNKKSIRKDFNDAYKEHAAQAEHHREVLNKTKTALVAHKDKLKEMTTKLKVKRTNVTKQRNEHFEPHVATASMGVLKDTNYYKRMGKLLHLAIDKSAQAHIRTTEGSSEKKAKDYMKAYNEHPLYAKMNKYMRKAASMAHSEATPAAL